MKLHTCSVNVHRGRSDFTIRHITDVHIGNEGFNEQLFKEFIRIQSKDKNSWWICTGDLIDADRPSMRDRKAVIYADRKDAFSQEDERNMLWLEKKVCPMLDPIKDRCLGVLDGDHYLIFKTGLTSGQFICGKLGLTYLGERMAYVKVRFIVNSMKRKDIKYIILARHGKGAAGTPGGDMNALIRNNTGFIADLYLGGHTHKEIVCPVPLLYPNKDFTKLKQKITWYMRGGSFLRGYPPNGITYAEINEYGPLCTGWGEINLTISKRSESNNNMAIFESSARMVAS